MSTELTQFEDAIVTILVETNRYSASKQLSAEECKTEIQNYLNPAIMKIEGLPLNLLAAAWSFAWDSVNWTLVASTCMEWVKENNSNA